MRAATAKGVHFGVYVHLPFCRVQCPYCTFFTVPRPERREVFARFLAGVRREWSLRVGPRLQSGDRLRTLYLGGGTPSDVPPDLLADFLAALVAELPGGLGELEETTVECNPESVTAETLARLRAQGVDRISLGVQALHPDDLRRLGRAAEVEQVLASIDAVAARFQRWSADLILGIPGSSRARLRHSLTVLQQAGAPHLSFYCLELPASRAGALGTPWGEERLARTYEFVSAWLEQRGYEHYEISSAARPGERARHNGAYWERLDYVGLGPGAHSFAASVRQANRPDLNAYLEALEQGGLPPAAREVLTPAAVRREEVLLGLRRREGVAWAVDGLEAARDFLQDLVREGLGRFEGPRFRLTTRGWMVSDSIVSQLLTYMEGVAPRVDKPPPAPLHST